jgi:hypothetical protein
MSSPRSHSVLAAGLAFIGCATSDVLAACPSLPTAERFQFVGDGTEVLDRNTSLIWGRCSVGQTWSGDTCIGAATGFSHEGALAHAASQSGWRLPNRRELSSIADKGCVGPSIDLLAFPSTPINWFWTSTPYVGDPHVAWDVYFLSGGVGLNPRSSGFAVRLVRGGQ